MDLLETLAKEHSKKQCARIVKYVGADTERFAALMDLFFKGEYRITQRSAWPVSYCVRAYPDLIRPYFKRLLDNLERKDLHVAVTRNTLRLLQEVPIPKRFHGRVMNTCFDFIQSYEAPIAVKAFSLTVLENMTKQYPEILPEIKLIINDQWENATPAFRTRARRILRG
jgi:hypothetical protein